MAAIQAWRTGLQEDRARASAAGGEIDRKLKSERRRYLRLQRRLLAGRYVRRELLSGALAELTRLFTAVLTDEENALPPLLAGREPGQIEATLRERFDAARQRLADRKTLNIGRLKTNKGRRQRLAK